MGQEVSRELCQAWIDNIGDHWYRAASGDAGSWKLHEIEGYAKLDGFTITWPDGPGLATLVPIPDVWARARAALAVCDTYDALRALLDAHDRGEL